MTTLKLYHLESITYLLPSPPLILDVVDVSDRWPSSYIPSPASLKVKYYNIFTVALMRMDVATNLLW